MKTLFLLCLLPLPLLAEAPKKPLPIRYTSLYTSSPFTTPAPVINTNIVVANPLEDWVLGGVTKFPDGYFVILINKKKAEEKVIIQPGMHSDFQVLEVIENPGDYTETVVKLRYGTTLGSVTFDKKLLAVKTPAQAQAQEGKKSAAQQGLPQGLQQGGNGPSMRPRTIAPQIIPPVQIQVQPSQISPTR